ncbi:MAG: carboxypeptidase-like regulatory domain-containing protein [Chitinophagaceae bacterium]
MLSLFHKSTILPFIAAVLLTGCFFQSVAQQEISVRVQVNRMPDGHYPTKIYQFSNTPGLVSLTLTNLTNATQNIYLTGKLTGDNGVLVVTSKNYQPPGNIELAPLSSRTLNAIEASYLFDANNLVYLAGNTSIKSSVFGEQGLPEGAYQLCIRAVDAATRRSLSDEDPIGCSNLFQVSLLEPPMILNPYDEQALMLAGIQNFPLRWTTPPGAPPSTEYLVRIVEIFGKRNPYDAMFSTAMPFFETTVRGTPFFLYSVQQPQMQPGRSYAMMVIASDPLGNGTFRNKGQSEVVQFTYGIKEGGGNTDPYQPLPQGSSLEYANHKITGRLFWAFKKTETGAYTLSTGGTGFIQVKSTATQYAAATGTQSADLATKAIDASPYLSATVSRNAFALQATTTPLISLNAVAAVNADPSLQKSGSASQTINYNTTIPALTPALPTGFLSASGASQSTVNYETITVDTAGERFALSGVAVTLHAAIAGARPILLATGKTDKEGNFSLEFLDPSYAAVTGVTGLTLTAGTTDFENTSIAVPVSVLKNSNAEIGNHTLLAKTFRLFPKIIFDSTVTADNNGYGFHIYRDARDLEDRPWLVNEGMTGNKKPENINGGRMIEIAADTIPAGATNAGKLRQLSVLDAKGAGRLFFGGSIYVSLVPSSADYYDRGTVITMMNATIPANKVAVARVEYKLSHKPSQVSGTVALPLAEKGKVPVQGALVRVIYKKADREPGLDPNQLITQTATLNNGSLVQAAVGATAAPAWTSATVHDPGITTMEALAYTVSNTGLVNPVIVQSRGNSSQLTAQAVLNPVIAAIQISTVPDDSKAVTTTADELGNYFVMLPPLKKNASITVEVVSMPADFRKFAIEAKGYQQPIAGFQLSKGGSKIVDFEVKADVADVVGRVVDDQGKALQNARINFKGVTIGETGSDGIFQTTIYPGTHSFVLEKEGYVVKTISVVVPQMTNSTDKGYASQWLSMTLQQKQAATLSRISQSQTVQASVTRGNSFSAAMFGIAAPSGNSNGTIQATLNGSLALAFGIAAASPGSQYEIPRRFAIDLKDVGYLPKIVGKARFRITDETNTAIAGVRISLFDSTHTTDDKGEWYYEGFGGSATLTLVPPAGTAYIAEQKLVNLAESGKEELIIVILKKGILISGIVNGGGKPLPGARILLDEQDFGGITTDASGHYEFYTTPGPHKIGARKQGFVGSDKNPADLKPVNAINFDLTGSNGRNYATLLGFAIELDEAVAAGGGQEKWTGNFVGLQPVDQQVFSLPGQTRIPFSNLVVGFDAQGNPVPQNNMVKTDATELPMKLFGYLPVKLTTGDVISFTRAANGNGQLSGKINIAFNAIQGYRGWTMNENTPLLISKAGAGAADRITVFSSAGPQVTDQNYLLTGEAGNAVTGKLYGFGISLKSGTVDKDGLGFTGSIATPDLAPIKSIAIGINNLSINRALTVSAVLLNQEALPELEIASWKAVIDGLLFNEDGFKIGGNMNLAIPKSLPSFVSFSDLSIAKDGLFGGKFALPESGINVLALADIKPDGLPLSFGRVGNSSVYRIAGKAVFKINVSILDRPLKVPSFEILTNGDFSVQVPVDYKLSLKLFDFAITNLSIRAKDNTPSILLQGQFKTDLSFIRFDVGDITIKAGGSGPAFSVAKVGLKLDVGVLTATAMVGFSDEGFEGEGGMTIKGAEVIGGSIGFRYYKRPAGVELGAKFFANIPPIPLGPYFTLDGVGGGFDYRAGGANGGFSVDVRAKLSVLGAAGVAVATVNPLALKVESAGILTGSGDVLMANFIKTSNAVVKFNGPEKTFSVEINNTTSPLEGLVSEKVIGTLVISAKKGDEFVFLGCGYKTTMIGLIDNHGELAVAVHLKNPKSRNDLTAHYFEYAPDDYLRERFSGVYINVSAQIGIPEKDALGFDLTVASARLWFAYGYNANLLLNFEENAYRLGFGGGFEMGIEACVAKVACVNISASMCIKVEGGRNNALGWNFMATASGSASLGAGLGIGDCDPGCNEVVGPWDGCLGGAFKLCGNASVDLNFNERNGLKFNARAGGNTTPCF